MDEGESVLEVAVKAVLAVVPMAVVMYYTEPTFRENIDRMWAHLRYRASLAEWRARVWDRLQPWERELYEQRHGRPE